MRTPPFYLGVLLVSWGFWVDLLPVGVALAVGTEGARLVTARFELTFADYRRVWQVSSILFLGLAVVIFNEEGGRRFYQFLQWLPAIFYPVVLARLYGAADRIDAAVFSILIAQRRSAGDAIMIDPLPLYAAVTFAASTAANPRSPLFLATMGGLLLWGLWSVRREGAATAWGIGMFAALGVGLGGGFALERAQGRLAEAMERWYSHTLRADPDPFRAGTMIGQIGKMKFSGRIVYRVEGERPSYLLPQATFDIYRRGTWLARKAPLTPILPEPGGESWRLPREGTVGERITVMASFDADGGLLLGGVSALGLERFPAGRVGVSRLGQVEGGDLPGFVTYDTLLGGRLTLPTPADTVTPGEYGETFDSFLADARLTALPPSAIADRLVDLFHRQFAYTLDLKRGDGDPLIRFLTTNKEGHCEYFATAVTLLLRRAGIPARYVVGYVAAEKSWLEGALLVRDRDAHAWSVAWIDGRWRVVDATPPVWLAEDREAALPWEGVGDLAAWVGRLYKRLRWSGGQWRTPLMGVGALLVAILLLRIVFGARRKSSDVTRSNGEGPTVEERSDSPFYRIETAFADGPLARREEETIKMWLCRLEESDRAFADLYPLARLHYRLRFDPSGLTPAERGELEEGVGEWLVSRSMPERLSR